MRYIIRAIKYFLYISVLFSLIIGILVLAGVVSADINVMFKNGWKSVGYILLLFAAVAAVYPNFGYGKFAVNAGGIRQGCAQPWRRPWKGLKTQKKINRIKARSQRRTAGFKNI